MSKKLKKRKTLKDEYPSRNGAVVIVVPATKPIKYKAMSGYKITEEQAKRYVDKYITGKQLRWLQNERP